MKRKTRQEDLAYRLTARHQIVEALRLCHGAANLKTLLNLCPWLNLRGAIEIGWLIEQRNGDEQPTYIAGSKLKEGKGDPEEISKMHTLFKKIARTR